MTTTIQELRKKPHWSYSALNCYLGCSLQYYFRYIQRAEQEKTPVCFAFGRAFHSALSTHYNRIKDGKDGFNGQELTDIFAEYFKIETADIPNLIYKNGENFDTLVSALKQMINSFLINSSADDKIVSIAEAFDVCVPGFSEPWIGELDMVVQNGRQTTIVDWKTASCRWASGKADRDLQATVFTYAYTQIHQERPNFRFDVITKTKNPVLESHITERGVQDFSRFINIANAVQKGVKAGIFIPSEPMFGCGDCPYQRQCKKWR